MKISIISPCLDIARFGQRCLSSYLKKNGFQTQLIFLPDMSAKPELNRDFLNIYPLEILDQLVQLCKDADLIGISLLTYYFDKSVAITQHLKKFLPTPIIWGGVHPTIKPEECIEFADLICIGEGEEALLELVQSLNEGRNIENIANIWIRKNHQIIKNNPRPPTANLDSIPIPDYFCNDHWVYEKDQNSILPMDKDRLKELILRESLFSRELNPYHTLATRGCPHNCTYCGNNAIRKAYGDQRLKVRRRSTEHIISELQWVKKEMPYVKIISFGDDSFFAASNSEIEGFAKEYKEKIGLPLHCLTSPLTTNERKLEALVEAGLVGIHMGIQTASDRINQLYGRNITNEHVLQAAKLINQMMRAVRPHHTDRYKNRLYKPIYDIILDNPYETIQDQLQTLKFLLKLPKPYHLRLFSLTFFPGTDLHKKALEDGIIKNEEEKDKVYRKYYFDRKRTYLNFLYTLYNIDILLLNAVLPLFLKILIFPPIAKFFSLKPFNWFFGNIYAFAKYLRLLANRYIIRSRY